MSQADCPFCRIADDPTVASIIVDTPDVLAFMDIDPVTPGHALVVPRSHAPMLADIPDPVATEMFAVARSIAAALRTSTLRCEGVNLFYADGAAALQEVFHAHLHVFPRHPDDGFAIEARWGTNPPREELDATAASIRRALGSAAHRST